MVPFNASTHSILSNEDALTINDLTPNSPQLNKPIGNSLHPIQTKCFIQLLNLSQPRNISGYANYVFVVGHVLFSASLHEAILAHSVATVCVGQTCFLADNSVVLHWPNLFFCRQFRSFTLAKPVFFADNSVVLHWPNLFFCRQLLYHQFGQTGFISVIFYVFCFNFIVYIKTFINIFFL